MSVYLEQPRASIDALQHLALVTHTLGLTLLAYVRHTLPTNWSFADSTQYGGSVAFADRFHLTVDSFAKVTHG